MQNDEDKTPSLLPSALFYAQRGWKVFPLVPRDKRPLTKRGVHDASDNPDQIRAWWKEHPNANIGLACGWESGLDVLDIDGPEGEESLALLVATHGALPRSLESRTARGRHIFFAHHGDVKNSAGKLGHKLDTRSNGGYVVAPPSVHPTGAVYQWAENASPRDFPNLPQWPVWAVEAFHEQAEERAAQVAEPRADFDRNEHARRYCLAAVAKEAEGLADVGQGGRNDALNAAAFNLGQLIPSGAIGLEEVRSALRDACERNGLYKDDGRRQFGKTFMSGVQAGMKKPRSIPEPSTPASSRSAPARAQRPPSAEEAPPLDDAPLPEDEDLGLHWSDELAYTAKGLVRKSLGNLTLILEHAQGWAGIIGYDERNDEVVFLEAPPWDLGAVDGPYPRALRDADAVRTVRWVEQRWHMEFPTAKVHAAFDAIGQRHSFDRVRDYLDALRWDGRERIAGWLVDYMGAKPGAFTEAVSARWLISAVARAFEPGCKADHVLVLEGAQGAGKSTALAALCSEPAWFTDQMGDVARGKDASESLQGPWLVEIAEFDALSRAEAHTIKAFITRERDRYRAAYARRTANRPRRCVFAASTNEQAYLKDSTGGRRFWPVFVHGPIRVEALRKVRDQLWAEAVHEYRAGTPWHLDRPELVTAAQAEQEDRYQADEWENIIGPWLQRKSLEITPRVTVGEALAEVGFRSEKDWARREQMRVQDILRRLGWKRVQRRDGPGAARRWAYEPEGAS